MTKYDLLDYVAGAGAADASDVARALDLSYSAAAMGLLRVLRQGLVRRYLDDDDRTYWYCLTKRGQERLAYFEKSG